MSVDRRPKSYTAHQIGALSTLVAVALWGAAVLWIHVTRPAGAHVDEIVPIATLTLLYWITIPLYAWRVRWGYIAGTLALLGLFAMGIVQAREGMLVFSPSPYNLLTLLVALTAATCIVLSLISYRQRPRTPVWRTLLGVLGAVLVGAIVFAGLSTIKQDIQATMARWTQDRIVRKLEHLETLDEQVAYLVAEGDIPSLAAGIVVNDQLVWTGAYGEQPDVETAYNIGSITKPVVATAVLQLYEQGLIDLDADVSQYLPFEARHPEYPEIPITVRMLLTHQSGLAHNTAPYFSYVAAQEILDWENERRGRSIYGEIVPYDPRPPFSEFMRGYLTLDGATHSDQVWTARPGMGYGYSTPGYDLLGLVVEQASGQPLETYLQENVFDPLDMAHTGRTVALASASADAGAEPPAIPHEQVQGVLSKANVALPLYARTRVGGGGLYSTVPDLARFMIAHLNQGQVVGTPLLEPKTVALMHRQAVAASADVGMRGYGLGLNTMRAEPWQYYGHFYDFHGATGHGGADYGYLSRMFFVGRGEGGYGVILLSDLSKFHDSDLTWFFAVFLKLDNLLMQEAEARFSQQAGQ
jgi:CubicO group peptidase (beta-lactamase class C family)